MFYDGSKMEKRLTGKKVKGKMRYYIIKSNRSEYYTINSKGVLECYDRDGLIEAFTIVK